MNPNDDNFWKYVDKEIDKCLINQFENFNTLIYTTFGIEINYPYYDKKKFYNEWVCKPDGIKPDIYGLIKYSIENNYGAEEIKRDLKHKCFTNEIYMDWNGMHNVLMTFIPNICLDYVGTILDYKQCKQCIEEYQCDFLSDLGIYEKILSYKN